MKFFKSITIAMSWSTFAFAGTDIRHGTYDSVFIYEQGRKVQLVVSWVNNQCYRIDDYTFVALPRIGESSPAKFLVNETAGEIPKQDLPKEECEKLNERETTSLTLVPGVDGDVRAEVIMPAGVEFESRVLP